MLPLYPYLGTGRQLIVMWGRLVTVGYLLPTGTRTGRLPDRLSLTVKLTQAAAVVSTPARPYIGRQVISTFTGISSFVGIASSDGGSILKSVSLAGIVPVIFASLPCDVFWKGTCLKCAV
jgi:hypothetical protein